MRIQGKGKWFMMSSPHQYLWHARRAGHNLMRQKTAFQQDYSGVYIFMKGLTLQGGLFMNYLRVTCFRLMIFKDFYET